MTLIRALTIAALQLILVATASAGDCRSTLSALLTRAATTPVSAIITINGEGRPRVIATTLIPLKAVGAKAFELMQFAPGYTSTGGPFTATVFTRVQIYGGDTQTPPTLLLTIVNQPHVGTLSCAGNVMFGFFEVGGRAAFTLSFKVG